MKKILIIGFIFTFFASFPSIIFSQSKNVRIDVMYFHATIRCQGCLTIEEFIKNSVGSLYAEQLKDSSITLKSIDFLQEENEHYQDDYKFDVQTLIISKKVNGKEVKWKNLDKIWDYSGDYDKFQKYIEEEINDYLKES
jgi:hypothetical protein